MQKLPDEEKMLEILELAKDFEQSARELSEMSTAIAHKYQKHMSDIIQVSQQEQSTHRPQVSTGDY